MKKALIFYGGWEGHEPKQVAERTQRLLSQNGYECDVEDNLEILTGDLSGYHLIVPCWSNGKITNEQCAAITNAVASGVGLAGCHGGLCSAFVESVRWHFMTGGLWIAHPGNDGVEYTVNIKKSNANPIIDGIDDFKVTSEQYYLLVDPAVDVLATTVFPITEEAHSANGTIVMPVMWTKRWGQGRVFYTSLGHVDRVFEDSPAAEETYLRGMLWASR